MGSSEAISFFFNVQSQNYADAIKKILYYLTNCVKLAQTTEQMRSVPASPYWAEQGVTEESS